jgi:hypothetical protein
LERDISANDEEVEGKKEKKKRGKVLIDENWDTIASLDSIRIAKRMKYLAKGPPWDDRSANCTVILTSSAITSRYWEKRSNIRELSWNRPARFRDSTMKNSWKVMLNIGCLVSHSIVDKRADLQ